MFCNQCGSNLADNASFCTQCGAVIKPRAAAQQAAPQPQQPVYTQQVAPQPQQPVYTQQVAPQPQQPVYTQQVAPQPQQPTYAQQAPVAPQPVPKKKNLGKILGLSIGIPVGATVILGGIIAAIFISFNKRVEDSVVMPEPTPQPQQNTEVTKPDVKADKAERTVMIYMIGSTLESPVEEGSKGGFASEDLDEMLAANIPEGVNVIIECGGAYDWVNPDVPDSSVSIHKIENKKLVMLENYGRKTMTEKGDLSSFIKYASTNYPAENYTIIFWDHGGGIPIGFGIDLLGDPDEMLEDSEIYSELQAADVHFDAVIFDACNMCSLEIGQALKDYSDYMVGAESFVAGIGISYTNFMNNLNKPAREFCEIIVNDYMDSLADYGQSGSMSVIRLDLIDDVYNAYVDYINSVSAANDFAGYSKAREACGLFEGTDSVDLITLANKYETKYSTPLINAVINSVVYTESTFAFGHGITAYSPYTYFTAYSMGRASFCSLDYDNAIIDFYDNYISEKMAYYGPEYVAEYGGDWFVTEYETVNVISDEAYELDVYNCGDYYAADIAGDIGWDIINTVEYNVGIDFDDHIFILGRDYVAQYDSDGWLALVDPESWVCINGTICTYYSEYSFTDDSSDEWCQLGYVLANVNGGLAKVYIYYDQDDPSGTIVGFEYMDTDTGESVSDIYSLEDSDVVDLVFECMDNNGNTYYTSDNKEFLAKDLNLDFLTVNLEEYSTIGWYTITDVYGQVYETDIYYLSSNTVI